MSTEKQPIETIKLSDRDKVRLTQALDEKAQQRGTPLEAERRNLRVAFQGRRVLITINPLGASIRYSVVPRNIARGGLAFIHGQFIYPQTRCQVTMPGLDGRPRSIDAQVVCCRHVGGIVHEVSLRFEGAIDLNDFVALTPEQSLRHDRELGQDKINQLVGGSPEQRGTVLLVDDFAADRKLFHFHLRKHNLAVNEAQDRAGAIRAIESARYDLAIIDMNLGGESGIELIRQFRTGGFTGPIVGVSADGSDQVQAQATEAGANAFLIKPCDPRQLEQVVKQLLSLDGAADSGGDRAIISELSGDEMMRPLLREFVAGLADSIALLCDASAESRHDELRKVCRQLKGAGSGYGFAVVTQTAETVLHSLEQDQREVEKVRASVNELIQVLRRVRFD